MRDSTSYAFKWVFRTHSLAELRNAGVNAIQYDPNIPLRCVRQTFPDQNNWMGESLTLSIGEVMSDWGYQGPLEMFSVMLCVLCDAGIQEYEVGRLQALRQSIRETRQATLEKHKYEGHPFLTIRDADENT